MKFKNQQEIQEYFNSECNKRWAEFVKWSDLNPGSKLYSALELAWKNGYNIGVSDASATMRKMTSDVVDDDL